jgi:hypothetical protein
LIKETNFKPNDASVVSFKPYWIEVSVKWIEKILQESGRGKLMKMKGQDECMLLFI